ncbi:MAG: hypothetical protein Q7S45_05140 [Candidatus Curtissbacteria bacterium]|nr:hypothetical protein [Candidatus Curtissbacteria bacterium]
MNLLLKSAKHKNLLLLLVGLVIAAFLYKYEPFHAFLLHIGELGYLGAFIAGILYDFTVTVGTSIVILLVLAEKLPAIGLGAFAATGAILGDYIIFRLVKDNLAKELAPLLETIEKDLGTKRLKTLRHIARTRYFHWMMPVVAAMVIGSPFPDEIAFGLMGMTKIKTYQVFLLSAIFNFIGIMLILSASNFLKP